MAIQVDPDALTAAAGQLSGTSQSHPPVVAQPPGVDGTSVAAVAQINAASAALATLLDHGSALRSVGGLAVANTAATLGAQDATNATAISAGSTPEAVTGPGTLPSVPEPQLPRIPTIPGSVPPLPGEAHARALYGGSGSGSLHTFADHWSTVGGQLDQVSATVRQAGQSIDDSWVDGSQQAGANTRRHADWVDEMAQQAHQLANHARTVAAGFETAKSQTPSPDEFATARQNLTSAMQRYVSSRGMNAGEVQACMQDCAAKQNQATSSALTYHGHVTAAGLESATSTLKTAPPIATGGGVDDTIVGPHTGPHIQMVDNGGMKYPQEPGKAPQIGPFPVPQQVADAVAGHPLVPENNPLNRLLLPSLPQPFTITNGTQQFYDELTAIMNSHGPADAAFEEARKAREIAEQALHQGCSNLTWTGSALTFVGSTGAFLLTLPVDWTPPGIAAALASGTGVLGSGAVLADCFAK